MTPAVRATLGSWGASPTFLYNDANASPLPPPPPFTTTPTCRLCHHHSLWSSTSDTTAASKRCRHICITYQQDAGCVDASPMPGHVSPQHPPPPPPLPWCRMCHRPTEWERAPTREWQRAGGSGEGAARQPREREGAARASECIRTCSPTSILFLCSIYHVYKWDPPHTRGRSYTCATRHDPDPYPPNQ
jgi:hypothetical protein